MRFFPRTKQPESDIKLSALCKMTKKLEIHRAIRSPVGSNPTHSAKSPAAPKLSGLSFCSGKPRSNQQNVHA